MADPFHTENTLVQQTTAEYLERQLGWKSIYAHNAEDFGPESLLGRNPDREVVLTRALRGKPVQLNPGLPDAAYDEAVRQITATAASQTMAVTNREKYGLVRAGAPVTFRNDHGDRVRDKESTRDAVRVAIQDFLWSDQTGLPVETYSEDDVQVRATKLPPKRRLFHQGDPATACYLVNHGCLKLTRRNAVILADVAETCPKRRCSSPPDAPIADIKSLPGRYRRPFPGCRPV